MDVRRRATTVSATVVTIGIVVAAAGGVAAGTVPTTDVPAIDSTEPAGTTAPPEGTAAAGGDISALEGASLTVGSKEFTEQLVLGAITLQMLEAAGADVSDETGLVGSEVVRAALLEGDIDVYWEYSGTGWITHLGNTEPVVGEREQYEAVRDADLEENGITWLEPALFNNTYAIALASERAEEFGLTALSELAAFAEENPDDFSLCAAAEFLGRDDGLPGLEEAYGFSFDDGGGVFELELGLVYTSVDEGDPCNFGEVFATDGRIAALDLTVLEDDEEFFPSYLPSLVVGSDVPEEQIAALATLFAPVTEALDNDTMQALNAQVDVDGEQPEDVAAAFLEENDLLPG